MAKSDELVKYITQRVVNYMDTPKDERKERKAQSRRKEPWAMKWFGMIPFAFSLWVGQKESSMKLKHRKHRSAKKREHT
ncbi:YqzE family protein [Paenibacillus barcinonensis]|uniref:YqzE family protein n=1 Tax=Paenibacillus barcinonensis TaxID=198119 RepID=A0A2V4W9T9_PAEBA|nr:YqzE family protein [Paenibacillus barcinonensis]PYE52331.1 YqzE-like protein [Paenibacillus barcinonensis]QKS59550.1 YqzE family protein [Paenibacillus barcinonensis]